MTVVVMHWGQRSERTAAEAARAGGAARQGGERRKDGHATTLDDSLPRPRPCARALTALPKLTLGRSSSVSRHALSPMPRTPRCQGTSSPHRDHTCCNSARSPFCRPRPRARRPRARPSQGTPALRPPDGTGGGLQQQPLTTERGPPSSTRPAAGALGSTPPPLHVLSAPGPACARPSVERRPKRFFVLCASFG